MNTIAQNVKAIFLEAIEKHSPEEWPAFLDEACDENSELHQNVATLLRAHQEKDHLFDATSPTVDYQATERIGQRIGPYLLREQIGTGGMGVVWAAEQKQPLRRKVALKVIKPGMDSEQVLARFEVEREALALMDHPNIARVLDAGTTNLGRPYFVMELIRGVPITEYCDIRKLTVRKRLELFNQVCMALQHAHQKGIIHRDIKPSNILVSEQDGQPVPKVIDFGVAKALHHALTDLSVYTGLFQAIGTLAYMSPEQAGLSSSDIDTRADIYSLGTLLYELLTGNTPFGEDELALAALEEACRIIREKEPPKPSTKISKLGERATTISQGRGTNPDGLAKLVRGDLDWIVVKALDKDRGRRYQTASSFAADVERFLRDDIIEARPPSFSYKCSKYFRRHRAAILTTTVVVMSLLATTAWALNRHHQAAETLAKLQETAREQAILSALAYDHERMRKMIEAATQAGAPEGWAKMVSAIAALFSGDAQTAVEELHAAIELGEDTLAVRALLAESYFYDGDPSAMLEEGLPLVNAAPTKVEDLLFLSLFLTRVDQQRSYQLAHKAFEKQKSPITLLVKAMARSHLALDSGNFADAELAISEAEAARMLLPESRYAVVVSLVCHMQAIGQARKHGNEILAQRYMDEGKLLAKLLLNYPDYAFGHLAAAWFFDAIIDKANARDRYHKAALAAPTEIHFGHYAQCLNRMGEIEEAKRVLQDKLLSDSIWKALIIAEIDEFRQVAREMLVQEIPKTNYVMQPRGLGVLCELGYPDEAADIARALRAEHDEYNDKVYEELLLLFAGLSNPERLLTTISKNATDQGLALLALAQYELGQRRPEVAKEYLAKSASVLKGFMDYDRVKHLLNRLASANPPPWWNTY